MAIRQHTQFRVDCDCCGLTIYEGENFPENLALTMREPINLRHGDLSGWFRGDDVTVDAGMFEVLCGECNQATMTAAAAARIKAAAAMEPFRRG